MEEEEERRRKRRKKLRMMVYQGSQFILQMNAVAAQAAVMAAEYDREDSENVDHRLLPRNQKKNYDHARALECVHQDYLGPVPIFDGKEFDTMFRISRSRFQRLCEDIGSSDIRFFQNSVDAFGQRSVSMECKLLLPLKTMAYGVASHCFRDYFSMSRTLARECCVQFDKAIKSLYQEEYLRVPTSDDLRSILALHKNVHKVDGMFGSLDCSHIHWKNCPSAWQGSFKGKEKKPTIVLETLVDTHMNIWHASFGYAGTLNDKTILNMSPFMDQLTDGTFEKIESEVTPYKIGNEEFKNCFILVDRIYPKLSRFVHGITSPITDEERKLTEWQESARKDVERSFGVLQGKWQCMARPMHFMNLELLGTRVAACLILHNMCVSDRVMEGDVRARYNPANSIELHDTIFNVPSDLREVQGPTDVWNTIGCNYDLGAKYLADAERWKKLIDNAEYLRLQSALKQTVSQLYF